MALHVKKGDIVEVITGDSRGVRRKVLSVDPVKRKVVVEGVNRVHKHVRPSRRNPQGGRLQIELPIDISNVMVVDSKTDRPTRVRFTTEANGQKKRVSTDGTELDIIRKK